MLGQQQVRDDAAADEMLLDDPLEGRRVALAIPRAFGIDHRHWAGFADAQAVGLAAQDAALFGQAQLLQAFLQKVPGRHATLEVAALGFGLLGAQEDVPARDRDADGGDDG